MSAVDTRWELIQKVKKVRGEIGPDILLMINGGIANRQSG